jgi:hypothetical protein
MAYDDIDTPQSYDADSPTPVSSAAQAASRSRSMDDALTKSGDALRQSFARNPVVPNAPVSAAADGEDGAPPQSSYWDQMGHVAKFIFSAPDAQHPLASAASAAVQPPAPNVTVNTSGGPRMTPITAGAGYDSGDGRGQYERTSTPLDAAPQMPIGPVGVAAGAKTPTMMEGNVVSNGTNPIDATNRAARAQLDVMNASEKQEQEAKRAAGVRTAQEMQGTFDARNAARAQHVDDFMDRNTTEWALNSNPRLLAAYKGQMGQGRGNTTNIVNPGAPGATGADAPATNYVQNALAAQSAGQQSLASQLLAKKGDLEQRAGEQGLVAGAQNIKKGGIEIEHLQRQQSAIDSLHAAKTPDEINIASQKLLAMQGKNPNEYEVKPVGGRIVQNPDGTTSTVGGYVVIVNKANGTSQLVGQPADQTAEKGYGQHAEGSEVQDKSGKRYVIRNGQPVPV